jgi:hypothetical protein
MKAFPRELYTHANPSVVVESSLVPAAHRRHRPYQLHGLQDGVMTFGLAVLRGDADALLRLKQDGKVREVGVCTPSPDVLATVREGRPVQHQNLY